MNKKPEQENSLFPMRLNKYIAHSGICSRRRAGDLVKEGAVMVNGREERNPAILVTEKDKVKFQGKLVKPKVKRTYLLLNKPRDVITTMSDEKGRKTVWDMVQQKVDSRIFPVGRLDRNTTGLLLLTDDGDLAKKLTHPSHKAKKIYHVVLNRALKEKDMEKILKGLTLEDGRAQVDGLDFVKGKSKKEVGIEIHMGKNRIVRRIFEALDYEVIRLDRVYFAGLTKKDLPRGWSRFLSKKEILMLKHFS
jgi:23S rRNA pseudouridine2605 synthase